MEFIIGMLYGAIASVLTFLQLQGQFKFVWMKDNPFLVALIGIPISMLYLGSVKHLVAYYGGQLWPSRLLGFAVGICIFTTLSWVWFKEPPTLKTAVCLALALCIMAVQILWK